MNSQKSFMNIFIFITLSFLLSGTILAQHQHGSDSTKTDKKKMECCKNMGESNNEMKCEKSGMKEQSKIDLKTIDKNKDGKVFQCPMCSDQVSDESGKCSKCGMDLKEVSIKDVQKVVDKKSNEMIEKNKKDSHTMDHSKMMNHDMKDADHDKSDMKKINIVREGKIDLKAIDKNSDGKVFQDQMCWNVISDEAGECPLCGMTLKEVSLEKAKENLLKNGFKDK
ncbi:MAG: heavy metal-binding domain-containing protein [Ignavibacteria bacterium]|nr:heavy metal-binding domain-containing protein [Ignavibacteria bacterium]